MPILTLFRIKVIPRTQRRLIETGTSRTQILLNLIFSRPTSEMRVGYEWHIGNVQAVSDEALAFAVGRTTKASREQFDEESGDFKAVEGDEAPFTYALLDARLGVLGLIPKARLAPTPKGIARSLEKMLNRHHVVQHEAVRIEISEIWDPEDFISQIHQAFSVVRFTVDVGHPNPFDVQEEFHKPLQKYVAATDARKGKAIVEGDDLNRDQLEEVTRSVASTGNDASARIRRSARARPITRRLRGDSASIYVDDEFEQRWQEVLDRLRQAYQRIRRRGDES